MVVVYVADTPQQREIGTVLTLSLVQTTAVHFDLSNRSDDLNVELGNLTLVEVSHHAFKSLALNHEQEHERDSSALQAILQTPRLMLINAIRPSPR